MTNTEQLLQPEKHSVKKSLTSLLRNEEIQGIALISSDGTMLNEILSEDIDKEKFGTIIATLVGSSGMVMRQLKNENIDKIIINSTEGKIIIMHIDDSLISAIVGKDANTNKIIDEIEKNLKDAWKVEHG